MMDNSLRQIKDAEKMIENAMWQAVSDDNHERELEIYLEAKRILDSLVNLSPDLQKEIARVLSYCLIRIANTESILDVKSGIEKEKEALRLAEISEDLVQIARSSLALGIGLLNQGNLIEAERQWHRVFQLAEGHDDDRDMQQVVGWTLIVRSNVLMGKSLYKQALALALKAAGILSSIDNYIGMAAANRALANAYRALGNNEQVEISNQLVEVYQQKAKEEHM
jgi:tetratricopeptide (TPR) repeat protein